MFGFDEVNFVVMGNGLLIFDNVYFFFKICYIIVLFLLYWFSLEDVIKFCKYFIGKKRNKFCKKYWYIFVVKIIDLCNFF